MNDKPTYREINGETRVGAFLRKVAPGVLETAGALTGVGALERLGKSLSTSKELSEADKAMAMELIELDKVDAQEVTKRWQSDNQQESYLPRNIRPIILLLTIAFTFTLIALESAGVIKVKESYVSMLEILCITTIGAYFGLREFGKFTKEKFR